MENELIVLEEYKQLWSYYHRLLDERKNLLEWYFKIVGLPLGIIGYFLSQKADQVALSPDLASAMLVVIFLVGVTLFGTYAKESSNAEKYHRAMANIRKYIKKNTEGIDGAITIDELRDVDGKINLGSTALWRILPLVFINSAVGSGALQLSGVIQSAICLASIFVVFTIFHYAVYKLIYVNHNR